MNKFFNTLGLVLKFWGLAKAVIGCIKNPLTKTKKVDAAIMVDSMRDLADVIADKNNQNTAREVACEVKDLVNKLRK